MSRVTGLWNSPFSSALQWDGALFGFWHSLEVGVWHGGLEVVGDSVSGQAGKLAKMPVGATLSYAYMRGWMALAWFGRSGKSSGKEMGAVSDWLLQSWWASSHILVSFGGCHFEHIEGSWNMEEGGRWMQKVMLSYKLVASSSGNKK